MLPTPATTVETQQLPLKFGKTLRDEFVLDPTYRNINHGSFGTIPKYILQKLQHYKTLSERRPDQFIRFDSPRLLDESRRAVAKLINAASVDDVVLVPNATTGVNTVLRNLSETWAEDGRDEILYFSTIYKACHNTIAYVVESTYGRVSSRAIPLTYPISAAGIVALFRKAVHDARAGPGHRRPRVAVVDVVSSAPGVRFPFEAIVAACRELGVLSLVDGAQGVGMLPLDLAALDPDFLVTNAHKWLFVPRGCAVLYVPHRNQHLMRSTLPTSNDYVPKPMPGLATTNPLPPIDKSDFAKIFQYVATVDSSPYLCVKDAIEWREKVLGGEQRIMDYIWTLAKEGGAKVAESLGTWIMENEEDEQHQLTDCAMVNVALPLIIAPDCRSQPAGEQQDPRALTVQRTDRQDTAIPHDDAPRIARWMESFLVHKYQTFIPIYFHDGRLWSRLSAQVYLDIDDFTWAADALKTLCGKVANKDYES